MMTRNEITEALLAAEVPVRFVSLNAALAEHSSLIRNLGLHPTPPRDVNALELALLAPMFFALDGVRDITTLANALLDALADFRPFAVANDVTARRIVELFCKLNDS